MDREAMTEWRKGLPPSVRTKVDRAMMAGARPLTPPYPDDDETVYAVLRDRHSLVAYYKEGPGVRKPEEWLKDPAPVTNPEPAGEDEPEDNGEALGELYAEEDPEAPPPPTD